MNRKLLLLTFVVFLAIQPGVGQGAPKAATITNVVYPTGIFPDDVANVQAALDQGGGVLLKAVNQSGTPTAFNFGSPEPQPGREVLIRRDVMVFGEQNGATMTTIRGGSTPFLCKVPVRSHIEGIAFEGPRGSAITITNTSGIEVVGNRISSVVPVQFRTFTFGDGIDVFGSTTSAKIVVSGNTLTKIHSDCCGAIQFDSVQGASEITGNTVTDVSGSGILALRSSSSVLIADNLVSPGADESGFGCIFVDGNQAATYTLQNNAVLCESLFSDGIAVGGLYSDGTVGATVIGNRVTMHNSFYGGISLYGQVSGTQVSQNTIAGDSGVALAIAEGFDPSQLATLNRFTGNDTSHHTSTYADEYFGTNSGRNEALGRCGSVDDEGTNNFITCGRFTTGRGQSQQFKRDFDLLRQMHQQVLDNVSLW